MTMFGTRARGSAFTLQGEVMVTIFRILATVMVRIVGMVVLLSLVYGSSPAAAQGTQSAPKDNPSEKLDKSGGVIKPSDNIDPKMQVNPPDPGPTSTPVIPPPGSPGGNPNVVPK
jgi:hypothetical protein